MEYTPHTLNQILQKIREQMRCPQCGTRVAIDFPSVKLAGDDFMLLQLKCESCSAFIVLHVNLTGDAKAVAVTGTEESFKNLSSTLTLDEKEMGTLKDALKKSGGSFEKLFKDAKEKNI